MKHAIKHEHPVLDIFEVTGKTNKADLSSEIRKTGQRGLQALFKKVYGAPTKSNNNCWLRRKLLQAAGGKQLSPAQTRSSPSRDHRIEVVERSVLRSPGEQDDAMASSSEYSEHSAASQQGFDSLPSPTNSVGDCRNYQADPAGELYNMARFQLTQGIVPDLSALYPVTLQLSLWDRLEQSIEEEQQLLDLSKAGLICQPELLVSSSARAFRLQPDGPLRTI
ncbi:hypothetical protein WJX84_009829 [Apatococcus fuscideae]|uniref:Uncharacterized protein n=1 Tax=Apatococcus fuscideae TaxID=2026836 RepID=A0AAW1SVW5_9CHLO